MKKKYSKRSNKEEEEFDSRNDQTFGGSSEDLSEVFSFEDSTFNPIEIFKQKMKEKQYNKEEEERSRKFLEDLKEDTSTFRNEKQDSNNPQTFSYNEEDNNLSEYFLKFSEKLKQNKTNSKNDNTNYDSCFPFDVTDDDSFPFNTTDAVLEDEIEAEYKKEVLSFLSKDTQKEDDENDESYKYEEFVFNPRKTSLFFSSENETANPKLVQNKIVSPIEKEKENENEQTLSLEELEAQIFKEESIDKEKIVENTSFEKFLESQSKEEKSTTSPPIMILQKSSTSTPQSHGLRDFERSIQSGLRLIILFENSERLRHHEKEKYSNRILTIIGSKQKLIDVFVHNDRSRLLIVKALEYLPLKFSELLIIRVFRVLDAINEKFENRDSLSDLRNSIISALKRMKFSTVVIFKRFLELKEYFDLDLKIKVLITLLRKGYSLRNMTYKINLDWKDLFLGFYKGNIEKFDKFCKSDEYKSTLKVKFFKTMLMNLTDFDEYEELKELILVCLETLKIDDSGFDTKSTKERRGVGIRRDEVKQVFDHFGIQFREDSYLTNEYILKGIFISERYNTLNKIGRRMAEMEYFHNFLPKNLNYNKIKKRIRNNIRRDNRGYYDRHELEDLVNDQADQYILKKIGGFPKTWPWMKFSNTGKFKTVEEM